MKSFTQYTFNVELLKYAGFVLCTPICAMIFNILVFKNSLYDLLTVRALASLLLLIFGLKSIMKAREIAEAIDARINNNDS